MTVGVMSVDKYTVSVAAERQDITGPYIRAFTLDAPVGNSGLYKYVFIYFREPPTPNDLGYQNPGSGNVIVYPPLRDFDHMYHLLQTEKPIQAGWTANSADNKLKTFELSTNSKEPLGEGPRDISS
jgi:hypothetical protein